MSSYTVNHDQTVEMQCKKLMSIGVAIHLAIESDALPVPLTEGLYDALGLIEVALANAGAVKQSFTGDDFNIIEGGRVLGEDSLPPRGE